MRMWTRFICFSIGLLQTWKWTFEFCEWQWISRLAAWLLASQERYKIWSFDGDWMQWSLLGRSVLMIKVEKISETRYLHGCSPEKTCVLKKGSAPWSLAYCRPTGFIGNMKNFKSCCLCVNMQSCAKPFSRFPLHTVRKSQICVFKAWSYTN
jgi:hypothetical protein